MKTIAKLIGMSFLLSLLAACGGGGSASFTDGGGGDGGGTTTSTVQKISLATTQTSVKSDNSNSATITAVVLDANNVVVPGETITFGATKGQLGAASAVSDSTGKVTVAFSSGTTDPSNDTATITATVLGTTLSASIPIQITGSTITLAASTTNLVLGGAAADASATLTVTVKNAAGVAVNGATVSLATTGTGSATISPSATGTSNVSGVYTATITATSIGTVTVTATGLGATASQVFNITNAGAAFQITTPSIDPSTLAINTPQTVTVSVPPGVTNVTFATSFGEWDGGANQLVTKAVSGGTASASLMSAESGTATVQAFDAANSSTFDSTTILITAPSNLADHIVLQAEPTTLAPSTGSSSNTSALTAAVYTSAATGNQPVSGVTVVFSLSDTTGGGESVSPVYGITDSAGVVRATFSSGSRSSGAGGVTVTATVYDSTTSLPVDSDSQSILINQTAGSVTISPGTTLQESTNTAYYIQPMTVQVVDLGGVGVANAVVTLSAWPSEYSTGYWVDNPIGSGASCNAEITGDFANEDVNENGNKDPGEDLPYSAAYATTLSGGMYSEDLNGDSTLQLSEDLNGNGGIDLFTTDGVLTPANSTSGSVPATVTTNANGTADFTLTYLKKSAIWITDRITAKVVVQGTETSGVLYMRLPVLKTDADACLVFTSGYNPKIYP